MIELEREKCTGCAACVNICKLDAVQMRYNEEGFLYPQIDREKCIECKQCQQVCPLILQKTEDSLVDVKVYAMQSRDKNLRIHSTSGGAFSELANEILEKGGSIVGAVYKENWSVEHQLINSAERLEELRRSKYQQSSMGLSYRKIKAELLKGKEVLFCGTPCQAAGLKSYLGKEYENLYVCDFICRGVPSPGLFQAYIKNLQEIYGSEVTSVWMKNKRNGWHSLTTVITFANGQEYVKAGFDDSYVQLFLKYNIGIRPSCYECQFKSGNSVADITLGDFWGLDGSELDDNLGTSAVICRTRKGKEVFDRIIDRTISCEMKLNDVKKGNPCLSAPVEKLNVDYSKTFYENLSKYGYQQAIQLLTEIEEG